MFGFGNSKQKKYKKALEEFLQKMISVKDYFEIIQARGKGQSQMAEMLGVKVSDTDYWAKEHFEEYKSRLSESNDPLAEIELRLKNYSFIKKEMEGFINYAKELEMNLTQGFVDDYYAVAATLKSLDLVKKEFSNESLYDEYGFRSEGEKNSKEHKIGIWKTYKTEDNGVTEYLTSEIKWVDHPIHGKFGVTMRRYEKVFFKNGGLKSHSYSPSLDSEEYANSIQKSGFKGKIYLKIYYYENGNIYHEKIDSENDDPNAWFETTLNQNGELLSKGHIKNGLRNGNWRISKEATYYIPIIVKVISDESIKDDKLSNATKGYEIAFSITDKSSSIAPKIKDSVVIWSTVDYDDTNRGYPFSDGIIIIDLKNAYTADESKSDLVNELASKETLYKIEIDGRSNISNVEKLQEKLQEKTGDRDMFEPDLKRGAFSTHKFELQKDDGIKVAEGWSLMLRSIIDGDYEVEEEAFFILPHVGRYGYTSDIVLFMHGNPFKEGEDYHQKILEKERKESEYVDDIVMIDERDYEEFDSYDKAYDVWIKTVKLWIDDLDKKT